MYYTGYSKIILKSKSPREKASVPYYIRQISSETEQFYQRSIGVHLSKRGDNVCKIPVKAGTLRFNPKSTNLTHKLLVSIKNEEGFILHVEIYSFYKEIMISIRD